MIEVLKQLVEASEELGFAVRSKGVIKTVKALSKTKEAIQVGKQAIAQLALDAKAENARELGLDYEPVCPECKAGVLYECVACSSNNYPPQRTEQEPVAWRIWSPDGDKQHLYNEVGDGEPLYTHSQRTWVGLTDEEIEEGIKQSWVTEQAFQSAAWWAETKLKEKNT